MKLSRIQIVINPAAGGVDAQAEADMRQCLSEAGREADIVLLEPTGVEDALRKAVDSAPDVLIVLAGDGTARAACELCGPDGPLVAPLAGGTMNMLPYAIYGRRPWQEALADILSDGIEWPIGGGVVTGRGGIDHTFYVAAILGAPALWAHAREAVRNGEIRKAVLRARYAYDRAFCSNLSFGLDGGAARRAEALTLLCPLISRAMREDEDALEADALDPHGAAEAFRLGFRALMSQFIGDWRQDPAVTARRCRQGRVWAGGGIPAILDGEPLRLPRRTTFRWQANAFRALAPQRRNEAGSAET